MENNKLFKILKDNSTWILGWLTFLGVIFSFASKIVEYITCQFYFSYYGLNTGLYKFNDQNFLYSIVISIIFMLSLVSVLYCINQIKINIKKPKKWLKDFLIIFIYNLYMILGTSKVGLNFSFITIDFIILTVIEVIFSFMIFGKHGGKKNTNNKEYIIKKIPFLLMAMILCNGISVISKLNISRQYNIIDNNKVIVYSNNDYYIILDCEIDNDLNEIIIYKGRQKKINNLDVYSISRTFKKVSLK